MNKHYSFCNSLLQNTGTLKIDTLCNQVIWDTKSVYHYLVMLCISLLLKKYLVEAVPEVCANYNVSAFNSIFTLYFFYSYKNISVPRFSTVKTAKFLSRHCIFENVFLLLHICSYDSESLVHIQLFTHAEIIYLHIMLEEKKKIHI